MNSYSEIHRLGLSTHLHFISHLSYSSQFPSFSHFSLFLYFFLFLYSLGSIPNLTITSTGWCSPSFPPWGMTVTESLKHELWCYHALLGDASQLLRSSLQFPSLRLLLLPATRSQAAGISSLLSHRAIWMTSLKDTPPCLCEIAHSFPNGRQEGGGVCSLLSSCHQGVQPKATGLSFGGFFLNLRPWQVGWTETTIGARDLEPERKREGKNWGGNGGFAKWQIQHCRRTEENKH